MLSLPEFPIMLYSHAFDSLQYTRDKKLLRQNDHKSELINYKRLYEKNIFTRKRWDTLEKLWMNAG